MMRMLIYEAWNSYRQQVLPADAGDVQILETRRAFFAGADAMYTEAILKIGAYSDEEAEYLLTDLRREMETFCQQVKAGAA